MNQPLLMPVSVGELVDRLTILALKCRHLNGEALLQAERQRALLQQMLDQASPSFDPALQQQLQLLNGELWQVEDALRLCEQQGAFGAPFVALARSVYRLNDQRAALKRAIDQACGSAFMDAKVYRHDRMEVAD